jgi:hypothetical protein
VIAGCHAGKLAWELGFLSETRSLRQGGFPARTGRPETVSMDGWPPEKWLGSTGDWQTVASWRTARTLFDTFRAAFYYLNVAFRPSENEPDSVMSDLIHFSAAVTVGPIAIIGPPGGGAAMRR